MATAPIQARRQDSVTGGAEINFEGHMKFILCEFERGTGAREIYPSLDQMNKMRSKDSKGFSCRNRKQVISKKKSSSSQNRHEIRCQSTKNTTLSLDLHSSSPEPVNFFGAQSSLGGAQFSFGAARAVISGSTAPVCPPVAPGLIQLPFGETKSKPYMFCEKL